MRRLFLVPFVLSACAAPVPFVERFDNGKMAVEGTLNRSKQRGVWTHYWPNGNKKAEGRYAGDVQVGPWTWWYENGKKRTEGSFASEHSTGRWRYWHPNGRLHMAGFFEHGRKTGQWSVHDSEGRVLEIGQYEDGKRTLRWTFRREGKLVEGWFYRDEMVGRWRYQRATGAPAEVDRALPDGVELVYEAWGDGGARRAGFVVRGAATGRWVTWHDGQNVRISGDFAHGTLTGTVRAYDPDGRLLATGAVVDGRPDGDWELRRGAAFETRTIDARAQPPQAWDGVWSRRDKFDAKQAMLEVERWLSELSAPRDPERFFKLPEPKSKGPLPARVVEAVEQKPPVPVPQSFLTRREIRDLSGWLSAYTKELAVDVFAAYEARPKRKDKAASRRLEGRVIEQVFRAPGGGQVDLRRGAQWSLVVMLRGFAGQVCPYCAIQLRALARFRQKLAAMGVRVVAIYPGPERGLRGFVAVYEDTFGKGERPPYEILYDVDSKLPRALDLLDTETSSQVLARPTTFLLDPKGTIRYAYVGRHRADRPAAESLIEKLEELRR